MNKATISIRAALFPSLVMEGAINPMIISGTQKLINCAAIYFTVTTMFKMAWDTPLSIPLKPSPKQMPTANATKSLKGRL